MNSLTTVCNNCVFYKDQCSFDYPIHHNEDGTASTIGFCLTKRSGKWLKRHHDDVIDTLQKELKTTIGLIIIHKGSENDLDKTLGSIPSTINELIIVSEKHDNDVKLILDLIHKNVKIKWSLRNIVDPDLTQYMSLIDIAAEKISTKWALCFNSGDLINNMDQITSLMNNTYNAIAILDEKQNVCCFNVLAYNEIGGDRESLFINKIKSCDGWEKLCPQMNPK